MEIKAADVAKLRKMTGAGMMDCKNALVEANGDYDRAQEIIREKGKLVAAKRADRETVEGSVIVKITADNRTGIIVGLGCETDFVSKNQEFKDIANSIAELAIDKLPADTEVLKTLTIGDETVDSIITRQTGKTGEKHQLCYYAQIKGEYVAGYIHMTGKLASVVAFSKIFDAEAAKEIAMQVAAMNPVSVSEHDCPAEIKERELKIGREKAILEGKPENILDLIAQGYLNKFYKESTLLNQAFIKEAKQSVADYIKSVDPEVKVLGFIRFSLSD
ncbi:MAG: translation elongation factor Ts [Prevotellaceae bacterium]|jgi:elongation factor Ts|nr:translation elongation factor Ts [Prevotellaceae bacterium]